MKLKELELQIKILTDRIITLEKKFDDVIRDKSLLYPLTQNQIRCLEEMRKSITETGKIPIRQIAKKLNISASLVSYTKIQFIKRGLIKQTERYEL